MIYPPCSYTGDHEFRHGGGACASCGYRLRCGCGRFVTSSGFDAHLEACTWAQNLPESTFCEACGDWDDVCKCNTPGPSKEEKP